MCLVPLDIYRFSISHILEIYFVNLGIMLVLSAGVLGSTGYLSFFDNNLADNDQNNNIED